MFGEEIQKHRQEKRNTKEFEREPAPGNEDARPIYTRMALRHLDVQTLEHYGIDFEYDQVCRLVHCGPGTQLINYRCPAMF